MMFSVSRAAAVIILCLGVLAWGCSDAEKSGFTEENWQEEVENTNAADYYLPSRNNGRFEAPWMEMGDKSVLDVLAWKLFERPDYTPEEKAYLPKVLPDTFKRLSAVSGDFILWIGHNSFLVRIGETYWVTDPIFSRRALLPARLTPPALVAEEVGKLAGDRLNIIISHNHYDHLDRASMKDLPSSAKVFVPKGLKAYVQKMNKPDTVELDWWESRDLGSGVLLVCLPAQHWSLRINQGRNRSLWASWLLITPEVTLYFGGDTGYFKGFREIGRKYPGIDYAFMATTAYHPRWFMHYQHMNIAEAVKGFEELGAKYFIPTQWGTFHLGSEPAGFPGLDLKRYIHDQKLPADRYKIMDIGQILKIRS